MSEPRGPVSPDAAARGSGQSGRARARSGDPYAPGAVSPEPARGAIEEAASADRQGGISADRDLERRARPRGGRPARGAGAGIRDSGRCRARRATTTCRPTTPMHIGYEPRRLARQGRRDRGARQRGAVDPDDRTGPRKDAKVIHVSYDPLASALSVPARSRRDLLIAGRPARGAAAAARMPCGGAAKAKNGAADGRRKTIAARARTWRSAKKKLLETVKDQTPIHPAWLAHCINQMKSEDAIVISELGVPLTHLNLTKPRSYMGGLLSGGLGFRARRRRWAQSLAAPEREVIVTVGDGSLTCSAIRCPITSSAAPRTCRRSPSSPTT